MKNLFVFLFVGILACTNPSSASPVRSDTNLARQAKATASSQRGTHQAANVCDGKVMDASRWLAAENDEQGWIELRFEKPVSVGVIDIFSGYQDGSPAHEFDVSLESDGKWLTPDPCKVRGNQETAIRMKCPAHSVTAIKLQLLRKSPGRIREIAVYESESVERGTGLKIPHSIAKIDKNQHQIAVNQVGYMHGKPKRFTAPLTRDGAKFLIKDAVTGEKKFSGKIKNGIGDFTSFEPASAAARFVVEIDAKPLKANRSDEFLISKDLMHKHYWQAAVDFFVDSRAVVGTHPSAYGGCPWRDGTYYDAIIPSLVLFFLSDVEFAESMPRQMDWLADKKRVLGPKFKFDSRNPCAEGVMDAVKNYYALDPPSDSAPDIVKLIHWGAGYYCVNPATKDPSGDPLGRRIHSQTIEQISYVLWAWPKLKKWLPESFYQRCRDLCFDNWESMGAFEISSQWDSKTYQNDVGGKKVNPMGGKLHPYKGRHPPGHSIVPNLIMYEVATREKRNDAKKYLDAAIKQTDWIIKNVDWNDPRTTKGQRVSEHRTITNLVWMLQHYPKHAPRGLKKKIEQWVDVAISRADNMWDFRRYDLENHWTIPKLNDIGNTLGLPAVVLAASWIVDDEKSKDRLEELAIASVDHVMGRNPLLAAAPSQPEMGFPEIERGWPREHPRNVCARLELVRGSISATPGSEMFPFNPEGRFRHAEGWVNYGACWCLSLAYFQFDNKQATPMMD